VVDETAPVKTPPSDYAIGSYCSSTAWGGLEMNVVRFLGWMRGRGWSTVLYARPDSVVSQRALSAGITVRAVSSPFTYGDPVSAYRLARMIRSDNVGVLLLHQSRNVILGVVAGLISANRFKLVYCQHMHVGGTKKDVVHAWMHRRLDAWVTPLPWLAARVLEKTVIPRERIHIIPHGIELQQFTSERLDKTAARRKLGLPEGVPLAGIIGRLDPKKGQDTAVRALARVHQAGHRLHLAVIGDQTLSENTGYAGHLHELIDSLNLRDFVHFRPHQDRPEYAFAAFDMFVLASRSETYGMVTIEAFASGLPVIGTSEGGTLDLIMPEQNGLLFPPGDDEALSAAICRYVTDREFSARMAARAENDAIAKYSHVSECEGWERLLATIGL